MSRARDARFVLRPVLTALVIVLPSAALHAQSSPAEPARTSPITFAIGGGFAQRAPFAPAGVGEIGYAAQANVEWRTPLRMFSLRGESMFANWGSDHRVTALTAGVVAAPSLRSPVLPYLVAGGGAYATTGAGRSPGWTLGAGLRVPMGQRSFVIESRIHAIDVGLDGARRGVQPFSTAYNRWQYTYTPLLFGIGF
jgi:hypothetical protein